MDPVTLACAVVPVTALLYGLGALRGSREVRRYRAVAERCAALETDPYHAAAGRWWPEDDTQAAAAQLLLDSLVTVNRRGNLSLTTAGADPARSAGHPLPDALLAALRRRTAPAALGNIALRDTAFRTAREEFHTAHRRRLSAESSVSRGDPGRSAAVGVRLVLAELVVAAAALVSSTPRGPVEGTAATATWIALVAQIAWFGWYGRQRRAAGRRDPLAEQLGSIGLHPALAELAARDPEGTARLRVGRMRTRRGRNRGRPRRRSATPAGTGA